MNIEKIDVNVNNNSNSLSINPHGGPNNIESMDLEPAKVSNMTEAIKSISTDIMPTGHDVIKYAENFKDIKYVYGSDDPSNGLDCSGFTRNVYKNFGIDLPRTSDEQSEYGTRITSLAEALPGDLLCFNGHVGIYMGDNKMIHASSGSGKVRVQENLDLYFHDMPLKDIRRVL